MGQNWSIETPSSWSGGARRDKPTIASFDPQRYSGLWYEVARYDTLPFEKGCTRATAQYDLQPDSTIRVLNTCYVGDQVARDADGKERRDTGVARIADPKQPGKLKIRFDRFPYFEGNYWIHWTDYDNYSIVGSDRSDFLWILSRRPVAPEADIPWIKMMVQKFGYDPKPLIPQLEILLIKIVLTRLGQSFDC